jgi:hypothetical protein
MLSYNGSFSTRLALGAALLAGLASISNAQTLTPPDSTTGCQWMAECSAPGTSLRMEERSRTGSGRGTKVAISPRVTGFPAGTPLTFWGKRIGQAAQWYVTGYTIDSNGMVTCADRAQHAALASTAGTGWCPVPLDSLSLSVGDAMEGEPFAFAISTPDGRQAAYAVVVPRPIVVSTPACGSLEATVVDADAKAISIVGRGFPAGAQVTTSSTSGKETIPGSVATDSTGRFVAIVTPGVKGGRGGSASFVARTGDCEVTVSYPWGRSAR